MTNSNKGTVLILVLWALGLLTVFAVQMNLGVQKKISLLSRLERKNEVRFVAAAGVQKARGIFYTQREKEKATIQDTKRVLHNNPTGFEEQSIGQGIFEVSYLNYDDGISSPKKMYGIVDEERKININKTDRSVLSRLFENVLRMPEKKAGKLASAVIDWRKYGQSEIVGFYSSEYYSSLEFPYEPKKADYEILEELLLVEGFDRKIYDVVKDFLTIYGEGMVNINTAPRPVLQALGLSDVMINKIFQARRGLDGIGATLDDNVITGFADIESYLPASLKLTPEESKVVRELFSARMIGWVTSRFFSLVSHGRLTSFEENVAIACVFNAGNGKIIYWNETTH